MFTLNRIAILVLLFFSLDSSPQDYIITWDNDTIRCRLSANPAKDRLRPAYKYKNGYNQLVAYFPNDSIRVYQPGQIKGYYRAKHGKSLLCDGYFHSVRGFPFQRPLTNAEGVRDGFNWYFMRLEENGPFASLYKIMYTGRRIYTNYYLVKPQPAATPSGQQVYTKKQITDLLGEDGIREDLTRFMRQNKSFTAMVKEYNRLKEMVSTGR